MHPESTRIVLTGGNGPSPYPMAVSRSTSGGTGWTRHSLSGSTRGFTYALAVAPSDGSVIYAGGFVTTGGATFRSMDYGASWVATDASPPDTVYGLAVHPEDADIVFAATAGGQYVSTDGGASWSPNGGNSDLRCCVLYPGCPDTMLVGGLHGVYISEDGGQTWAEFNDGLECTRITCLAFSGTDGVELLAGTDGGVPDRT